MSTKLTEAADATDQQSVLETNAKQGIAKTQGTDGTASTSTSTRTSTSTSTTTATTTTTTES